MKDTPPISNARAIAQEIAGLLWQEQRTGVRDVFLFGSTLTSSTPHDIDLGIIYDTNSQPLRDAQFFSGYGRTLGPGRSIDERAEAAHIILNAFVPTLQDSYLTDEAFFKDTDPRLTLTGPLRVQHGVLVRAGYYPDAHNHPVYFPVDRFGLNDFYGEVEEHARTVGIPGQINRLLHSNGLDLSALDMQLLDKDAMHPSHGEHLRRALIAPCKKDYTFWSSVLSKAQCYNPLTHQFDRPIEKVYPGATEHFKASERIVEQRASRERYSLSDELLDDYILHTI